jgi:hypothetical protein
MKKGFHISNNRDGIIESKSPEGKWEPYMNPHWPYGA